MAITRLNYGSSFTNLVKSDSFLDGNPPFFPSSYESIATVTAAGGETSLTFSSIPSTYKSLQIRLLAERNTTVSHNMAIKVRLNGGTGTSGAHHQLYGDGAAATAAGTANTQDLLTFMAMTTAGTANSNLFAAGIIDIVDYASTTKNKTIRTLGGFDANGAGRIYLSSGLYALTTAVSSLTFYFDGDDLRAGSTFALYGIKGE